MGRVDVEFNSRDWDSINEVIKKINEEDTMLSGTSDDGELMIFEITRYENTNHETDYDILHTSTIQNNGWVRHNYYDPVEFTVEEVFKR